MTPQELAELDSLERKYSALSPAPPQTPVSFAQPEAAPLTPSQIGGRAQHALSSFGMAGASGSLLERVIGPNVVSRGLHQFSNWPAEFGNRVLEAGRTVANWALPQNLEFQPGEGDAPLPYNLPESNRWQDATVDVLSQVGKQGAEMFFPGSWATRAARGLGAGNVLSHAAGGVATGLAGGLVAPEHKAATAGEFAALGALGPLPAAARIPLSAAVPVASQMVRGEDPLAQKNLIQTGIITALGAAPEAAKAARRLFGTKPPPLPAEPPPATTNFNQPSVVEPPSYLANPDEMRLLRPEPPPLPQTGAPARLQPSREVAGVFGRRDIPASEAPSITGMKLEQPAAAPIPSAPKPSGGIRPALAMEGKLVHSGKAGESHFDLKMGAAKEGQDFAWADHAFTDDAGNVLNRAEAWTQAKAAGLIKPEAIKYREAQAARTGKPPELDSGDLIPATAPMRAPSSESGRTNLGTLSNIAGAASGGLSGYAADPEETGIPRPVMAILGAASGLAAANAAPRLFRSAVNPKQAIAEAQQLGAVPKPVRSLLRRSADYRNKITGQTPANKAADVAVKWSGIGEDPAARLAVQRGIGFKNTLGEEIQAANRKVTPEVAAAIERDPAKLSAVRNFVESPGTSADEAILRSKVGGDYAEAIITQHRGQRTIQAEGAKAEGGPGTRKGALFNKTIGTYLTQSYLIDLDPTAWQKGAGSNPRLFNQVLDEAQLAHPGVPRTALERDLQEHLTARMQDAPFDPTAGNRNRISQLLYRKRDEDLSAAYKELTGLITNPRQQQALTINKLLGNAQMFRAINELDAAVGENGVKIVLDDAALDAAKLAGKDVSSYVKLPESEGLGKIAGKYVPVTVANRLQSDQNIVEKFFGHPALRKVNSIQKGAVTVANWATHARQWIQMPFFALASRANPMMLPNAIRALRDPSNPLWREMRENNIIGANFSASEFAEAPHQIGAKMPLWQKGWEGAKKLYGKPDDLIRSMAYITAKKRFGGDIAKAAEFVDKFTMNYSGVNRTVALARNIPIVNPFISFVSEMMRVSKNLAVEAVTGKTVADKAWALSALGGMWGAGELLSRATKSRMSEQERKEWEQIERLAPSWQRYQGKLLLGKNQAGGRDFIGLSALTPTGDLASFAKTLAANDWEALLNDNSFVGLHKSPLVSAMLDVWQREHHFTGMEIDTAGKAIGRMSEAVLPPLAGYTSSAGDVSLGGYEGKKLWKLGRNDGETINPRSGQVDSVGRAALRTLGGVNIQSLKREPLFRKAKHDYDEAQRKLTARLQSELRVVKDPERRTEIRQRFKAEKLELRQTFLRKIGQE